MAKRQYTEEQKQALRERLAVAREKKAALREAEAVVEAPEPVDHTAPEPGITELMAMVQEMKQKLAEREKQDSLTDALLALAGKNGGGNGLSLNKGRVVGTTQKYSTDKSLYSNPVERLKSEPRLVRIAFSANYELEFEIDAARYETKDGVNMEEPKFTLKLIQIVLDENGEPTNQRIGKAKMVFFEDPATAMEIANRLDLPIDTENEQAFLNEMRYMRMREWLFECFWPPKSNTDKGNIREMVVNGQVVQTWEVSSESGSKIPFDQLDSKLRA